MHLAVYVPLLLGVVFALSAPALARGLPPVAATWLLSAGSLVTAAGAAAALGLLGFTLVAQSPLLASSGHWSYAELRSIDPVATPVGALAVAALVLGTGRLAITVAHWLRALRDTHRLAADLPRAGGELAVIEDAARLAYAVPGRPGRIVVSTGLLLGLDAGERRAVLAHERAHLRYHHHLHHAATQLARAVNPLLGRVGAAVALSTERWADEAAADTCRRGTVASALIRAAVGGRPSAGPVVLGAADRHVADRVRALAAPAPRLSVWRVGVLLALLGASAATAVHAAGDAERLLDVAQYAYHRTHG